MRLTINLDQESNERLEELVAAGGESKSQIVRDALTLQHNLHDQMSQVDHERLFWYVRLLGSAEHRILDVEHIDALISEIDSLEDMEDQWRHIGQKHGIEWRNQFDSLEEKLRVLEYCNWYTITTVNDRQFTLTFQNETEATLVGAFIDGECDELGFDVDIQHIGRKLVITGQERR